MKRSIIFALLAVAMFHLAVARPATAQTRIGDICTVLGQQERKLIGLGLVVGLDGTGDSDKSAPTMAALAQAMKIMGNDVNGMGGLDALKGARNAALVYVSVTLPAAGAAESEKLDCTVTATAQTKKSLKGGHLLPTPLISAIPGEDPNNPGVYAYASGPLMLQADNALTGTVSGGCTIATNMLTPMEVSGKVVLVIDAKHTSWGISTEVAEAINVSVNPNPASTHRIARAINLRTIEVDIPNFMRDKVPVFISEIMSTALSTVPKAARVVVDERSGTVVIDPEVEIDATVFSVPGINVQIGANDNFAPFDPQGRINPNEYRTAKLQALVDALNAIKVPSSQVISIIRTLDEGGKIHGHVDYLR